MKEITQLKRNDSLEIGTEKFVVKGVLELKQGAFTWKELLLANTQTHEEAWLNIEPATGELILYKTADASVHPSSLQKPYLIIENGKGTVTLADAVKGVFRGDVVEFTDYMLKEDTNQLFSYEKWGNEIIYFVGKRVSTSVTITAASTTPTTTPTTTVKQNFNYWNSLALGQKLKIQGEEYYVAGFVVHKQGTFQWKEYKLRKGLKEKWLSVEKTGKRDAQLSLSESVSLRKLSFSSDRTEITYQDTLFRCIDTGNARAIDMDGDVDFDYNEAFSFAEYESDGGKQLSIEEWPDETEASLGEVVEQSDIEVLEGKIKKTRQGTGGGCNTWIILLIIGAVVWIIWGPVAAWFSYPVRDGIKKHADFAYETTVTSNNKSSTKSDVYSTFMSTDAACRKIIEMAPEDIKDVITSNDSIGDDQILVLTSKESALIYMSEEYKTYVQVSKREEDSQGHTSYRAYRPSRLHRFYSSGIRWSRDRYSSFDGINTSQYDSYVSSARQASINARQSQGGGTSFGK